MTTRETIGGVPLGLSWDYAHLPRTKPLRTICCQGCQRLYEDGDRLTPEGCRILAVMCATCREEGRLKWITAMIKTLKLPTALISRSRHAVKEDT